MELVGDKQFTPYDGTDALFRVEMTFFSCVMGLVRDEHVILCDGTGALFWAEMTYLPCVMGLVPCYRLN